MDTIYNVGDTVYIEAKVKDIYINEEGIKFLCMFKTAYDDDCRPSVGPEILRKSLPSVKVVRPRPNTESIKEDSSNAET